MAGQSWREVEETILGPRASRPTTPLATGAEDHVFGEVWARPGLSRRDRRLLTIALVGTAQVERAMANHVYAALALGDLTVEELLEFDLHFAVYAGWPRASTLEGVLRAQLARICAERGEEPVWPPVALEPAGPGDLEAGLATFAEVNGFSPGTPDTPFLAVGVVGFVFGHLWNRGVLSRRDRRLIAIGCVATSGSTVPIRTHITTALTSGDLTPAEMDEVVLHVSAYVGLAAAEVLADAAAAAQSPTTP